MPDYRIAIGRFWHESNSFCSVTTDVEDFRATSSYGGTSDGDQVLDQGITRNEVTGFVDVFGRDGRVEIIPTLSSGTLPSGLVTDEAVAYLEEILRRRLRAAGRLDGVCFALHGAMSGTSIEDLDGHFLQVIRDEVGPAVPIVVALDCHAVLSGRMFDLTTAMTAYRTHPHLDLVETGAKAAHMLLDVLDGKTRPVVRTERLPMLFTDPGFDKGPLKDLYEMLAEWDKLDGVISCSFCPSFPYQDVPDQAWTAIAVTDNDDALAQRLAGDLARRVGDVRHALVPKPMLSPKDAVRRAIEVEGRPVVIADPADNVGGGAPGDTTAMLEVLLAMRGQVDGLIVANLPDADAIEKIAAAAPGDTVKVDVGGKRDRRFSKPLAIEARVEVRNAGTINNDGKFGPDPQIEVGRIVLLSIDNVRLVLTDRPIMGPQPSLFRKVGIDPFEAKIAMLKTGTGYKQTYAAAAKAVFRADCPGAVSPDISNFDFHRVVRPIFPIDPDATWQAGAL